MILPLSISFLSS